MVEKYLVESRKNFTEIFDNYIFDYVQAQSKSEAIAIYKQVLLDMGAEQDEIELYEYKVTEV